MKGDEDKMNYLKVQLYNVYLHDIIDRYDIRLTNELEDLLNILASEISSLTNTSKIASIFKSTKKLKVSANIINKFIGYFEDVVGLRNAKLNFRQV